MALVGLLERVESSIFMFVRLCLLPYCRDSRPYLMQGLCKVSSGASKNSVVEGHPLLRLTGLHPDAPECGPSIPSNRQAWPGRSCVRWAERIPEHLANDGRESLDTLT